MASDCVRTYATTVTSKEEEPNEALMDAQEAEAAAGSGGESEVAPTTVVVAPHSGPGTLRATVPATLGPEVMTP